MQLPRLIVTDLDGTLLPDSKVLPVYSREVLGALAAKGVRIALASGKFFHLTEEYAQLLGVETAVVALDGARNRFSAHDGRANGKASGISRQVALELLEAHDGAHLEMFADNGNDEILLRFNSEEVPPTIQQWATRIHRVEDARGHMVGDPALLAFYGRDLAELRAIAAAVEGGHPELRTSVFDSSSYGPGRVVIQQKAVTKGSGVLEMCGAFDFAPGECMVFGDWYNDLTMFAVGCVNVATANAVPEVKAAADHVTGRDCNGEGVAHFLAEAFL
jgi:hydroxymethylpyrimidine pyrophosphatase-like HAD family hydrolase